MENNQPLIECPYCHQMIASHLTRCNHCGNLVPQNNCVEDPEYRRNAFAYSYIVVMLVACCILLLNELVNFINPASLLRYPAHFAVVLRGIIVFGAMVYGYYSLLKMRLNGFYIIVAAAGFYIAARILMTLIFPSYYEAFKLPIGIFLVGSPVVALYFIMKIRSNGISYWQALRQGMAA